MPRGALRFKKTHGISRQALISIGTSLILSWASAVSAMPPPAPGNQRGLPPHARELLKSDPSLFYPSKGFKSVIERQKARRAELTRDLVRQGLSPQSAYSQSLVRVTTTRYCPVLCGIYLDKGTPDWPVQDLVDELFSLNYGATNPLGQPGSMREHYLDMSYGTFDLQGGVYGWFAVPQSASYYYSDDNGLGTDRAQGEAGEFIEHTLQAADPTIDFRIYDNDGPDNVPDSGDDDGYADLVMFVVHNHEALRGRGRSVVIYLPKIQTAEEAALWNDIIAALESHLQIADGSVKVYVLVEQLEACFQLMEIRAALGSHFVGFNTGRWDYINSVADAMAWDPGFIDPNIDAITMTYGYMRHYEDRVRRAVNTPDRLGQYALWQGGMEPNIPVGSAVGVARGMERAVAGAQREQQAGASGKWVAHWKMVHIVRPVWEQVGQDNQLGRAFPALTYTEADAAQLALLEPAPRTVRGARDLLSVAIQYGNAFGQGFQAAALKPADFFGNDDVLYLMEDMATGEIRLSILWEWLHKGARLTEDDQTTGIRAGEVFSRELFSRLLAEEYEKLQRANNRDVHDNSKGTTLPIAREIVDTYVRDQVKLPWYIDLLNINLGNFDLEEARRRIARLREAFRTGGRRITENVDWI